MRAINRTICTAALALGLLLTESAVTSATSVGPKPTEPAQRIKVRGQLFSHVDLSDGVYDDRYGSVGFELLFEEGKRSHGASFQGRRVESGTEKYAIESKLQCRIVRTHEGGYPVELEVHYELSDKPNPRVVIKKNIRICNGKQEVAIRSDDGNHVLILQWRSVPKRQTEQERSMAPIEAQAGFGLISLSEGDTPDNAEIRHLPAGGNTQIWRWEWCPVRWAKGRPLAVGGGLLRPSKNQDAFADVGREDYVYRYKVTCQSDDYPVDLDVEYEFFGQNEESPHVSISGRVTIPNKETVAAIRSQDGNYMLLIRWKEIEPKKRAAKSESQPPE